MSVGAVNKQTGDRIPTAGMPAIDDALSLSSTNPVQNAIITAALADKQDKTDNNLTTTDKTTTGAINELKSGLTNYELQNNINLMVADRVNLWACGDLNTASESNLPIDLLAGQYTFKCTMSNTSSALTLRFNYTDGTSKLVQNIAHDTSETFTLDKRVSSVNTSISGFVNGDIVSNIMLNVGNTALTYVAYVPSVETRLDTLNSNLSSLTTEVNERYYYKVTHAIAMDGGYVDIDISGLSTGKGYLVMCCGKNNQVWRYAGVLFVMEANGATLYDLVTANSLTVSVEVGTYTLKVTNNNAEHNQNINVKIIG